MQLDRVGIKVFCRDGGDLPLTAFIPVFHRWIQTGAVEGLLIDVADYSHMHGGPGVVLVADEGIYGIDETGSARGLVYYARRLGAQDLAGCLVLVARRVLHACALLEREPEFAGRLRFGTGELHVFANDRLLAPNHEETRHLFEPSLRALLARLYPAASCRLEREPDPRERFALRVSGPDDAPVATLLERLS